MHSSSEKKGVCVWVSLVPPLKRQEVGDMEWKRENQSEGAAEMKPITILRR